jgi:hypothetical protein
MHHHHRQQQQHQQLGRRLVRRVVLTVLLCSFFGELGPTHPGQEGVGGGRIGGFAGVLVKAAPQQTMSNDSREERKRQRERKQTQAQEQYNEYLRMLEEGANQQRKNQNGNGPGDKATTTLVRTIFLPCECHARSVVQKSRTGSHSFIYSLLALDRFPVILF